MDLLFTPNARFIVYQTNKTTNGIVYNNPQRGSLPLNLLLSLSARIGAGELL